ncbi:MAG TPA: hypothetical protein VGL72_04655 [Bryobacteraceae bacterium]|jgi:hypothetical protein
MAARVFTLAAFLLCIMWVMVRLVCWLVLGAGCLYAQDRWEVERQLAARLDAEPENVSVLLRLAQMRLEDFSFGHLQGLYDSQNYYQRVLEIEPNNVTASYGLALVCEFRTGGCATPYLRRVLEIDPENSFAIASLDAYMLDRRDKTAAEHLELQAREIGQRHQVRRAGRVRESAEVPLASRFTGEIRDGKLMILEIKEHLPHAPYPRFGPYVLEDTLKYTVTFASDKTIKNIVILRGHPMLVDAGIKAIDRWRFWRIVEGLPVYDGGPVEVTVPMIFVRLK